MSKEDVFPTFYGVARLARRVGRLTRSLLPGLTLALVLGYVVANVSAGRALERELAQIREKGEPLSLREAAPPAVPDDENAALVYLQAFQRLPRLQPSPTVPDPKNQQVSSADDRVLREFISEHGQRPAHATTDQVRAVLSGTDEALALVRRAAAMPRCRFPVDWEAGAGALFPHLPKLMALTRMMGAHAIVAAQDGSPAEAMADLHAILGLTQHLAAESLLINQMVDYVCLSVATASLERVLETTSPGETECQQFYQELAAVDLYGPFEHSLQSERCLGLWAFDMLHSHPESLLVMLDGGEGGGPQLPTRLGPLGTPMTRMDGLLYLQTMARQVALAKVRGRAATAALEEADLEFPWYASMSRALLPALDKIRNRRDKTLAGLALAQCGLALNVHHERTGRFPVSLTEVERTVGWALPKDPFTGLDLAYQPQGDGYLLYSFGLNGRDDHGQNLEDPAHRTSPRDARDQDDIAWWFGAKGTHRSGAAGFSPPTR